MATETQESPQQKEVIEKVDDATSTYSLRLVIIFGSILFFIIVLIIVLLIWLFSGEEEDSERVKLLSKYEQEFITTSQSELIEIKQPIYFQTPAYTVNLRDGRHYLKTSIRYWKTEY